MTALFLYLKNLIQHPNKDGREICRLFVVVGKNGGRYFRMIKSVLQEKALLDIREFCDYLGIGETKGRELLKLPRNGFALKIGSKWYAHKQRLDAWLLEQCNKY